SRASAAGRSRAGFRVGTTIDTGGVIDVHSKRRPAWTASRLRSILPTPMPPRMSADGRRTPAPAAVMALGVAAAALLAPACSKRLVDPPRSARAPLTRLFPAERASPAPAAQGGPPLPRRGPPTLSR